MSTAVGESLERDSEAYCDYCGDAMANGKHEDCRKRRQLEPPRYCSACRRRMKVQVLPRGWVARCVEHGEVRSATSAT